MLQDDSSDSETSSSEYEASSEDDKEESSPSSISVIKSDLFVTGDLATLWKLNMQHPACNACHIQHCTDHGNKCHQC